MIFAIVGQVIGWIGVVLLIVAGSQMVSIESVAGNTVAEAFYNAVGVAVFGAATALASALLRGWDA